MVSTVRLTRPRHPFEGRQLPVLGRMRRHGAVELLVVLPDGSKRLVPAAWTDLGRPATGWRRWDRSRTCWGCRCWFPVFPPGAAMTGSRLHGSHRARRTTVQPVQLSLLPDQVPAPPPALTGHLPAAQVEAALMLLARLIAKAAGTAGGTGDGDE